MPFHITIFAMVVSATNFQLCWCMSTIFTLHIIITISLLLRSQYASFSQDFTSLFFLPTTTAPIISQIMFSSSYIIPWNFQHGQCRCCPSRSISSYRAQIFQTSATSIIAIGCALPYRCFCICAVYLFSHSRSYILLFDVEVLQGSSSLFLK